MSAAVALARGRALAESQMVDACVIRRTTGETTDPNTGVITPTKTTLYTGKCRVQSRGGGISSSPQEVGEAYVRMLQLEVQLPMVGTEGLRVSDEVEITASVHDSDLPGRIFLIRDLAHKSHATARRVQVQERTS